MKLGYTTIGVIRTFKGKVPSDIYRKSASNFFGKCAMKYPTVKCPRTCRRKEPSNFEGESALDFLKKNVLGYLGYGEPQFSNQIVCRRQKYKNFRIS